MVVQDDIEEKSEHEAEPCQEEEAKPEELPVQE